MSTACGGSTCRSWTPGPRSWATLRMVPQQWSRPAPPQGARQSTWAFGRASTSPAPSSRPCSGSRGCRRTQRCPPPSASPKRETTRSPSTTPPSPTAWTWPGARRSWWGAASSRPTGWRYGATGSTEGQSVNPHPLRYTRCPRSTVRGCGTPAAPAPRSGVRSRGPSLPSQITQNPLAWCCTLVWSGPLGQLPSGQGIFGGPLAFLATIGPQFSGLVRSGVPGACIIW
mmetsp:Transcript_57658/g.103018  ORF Transcript_57658/g.103018 Transcript_57658/m.103018 type:complete len:228 (+) Transcript_57658:1786-2469(+)